MRNQPHLYAIRRPDLPGTAVGAFASAAALWRRGLCGACAGCHNERQRPVARTTRAKRAIQEATTMSVALTMEELLIGGKRMPAADGKTFATVNPATGETLAQVAQAGVEDVERAVAAARKAFDEGPWPNWPAWRRAKVLNKIAAIISERVNELATLESKNCGKTITYATAEVKGIALCFEYYAGAATKVMGETIPAGTGLDFTRREPVGVAGQIIPWNYPIVMAAWKLAPALAVGCSVILKPAGLTPLTALALGQICVEAGVPEGVVSVLPGHGSVVGAALVKHPGVDKIAFTGSTEVGRTLMRQASDQIKRISLEL